MTIEALKGLVLRQLGEDVEDVEEFDDLLDVYLNQGYIALMEKRKGSASGIDPLSDANNLLPERVHPALADYATYRILMNGNALRQQRSQAFLSNFEDARIRLKSEKDEAAESENGGNWRFTGLYDY
jgi:hypothetical protein